MQISKSGTMFIGERLWNKVDWGKDETADSSKRSLAKAIAWRIFAALNTLVAATVRTTAPTPTTRAARTHRARCAPPPFRNR